MVRGPHKPGEEKKGRISMGGGCPINTSSTHYATSVYMYASLFCIHRLKSSRCSPACALHVAPGSTACHKATKWSQEAGEKETCKEILMKSGISQCDKGHRLKSYLLAVVKQ